MTGHEFSFAGATLIARTSGVLFWPRHGALIVADLHLGKSARMARRGGALLPPFETRDTLDRLADEIMALNPAQVILLGDSFDDDDARAEIGADNAARLHALALGRHWRAISGNHDPATAEDEIVIDGITLRHQAGDGPDISGHYHPKVTLAGQRRPAFLVGAEHLILPAFGTYTGGLDADTAPINGLIGRGMALVLGRGIHAAPLGGARR